MDTQGLRGFQDHKAPLLVPGSGWDLILLGWDLSRENKLIFRGLLFGLKSLTRLYLTNEEHFSKRETGELDRVK